MSGIIGALLAAGGGGAVVSIDDQSISDLRPTTAQATYELSNDGNVRERRGAGSVSILETWVEPTSATKSDYEARATVVTGTDPNTGDPLNTWLSLSGTRQWGLIQSDGFALTCELTIEIRLAAGGTVLDTATVFLTAEAIV